MQDLDTFSLEPVESVNTALQAEVTEVWAKNLASVSDPSTRVREIVAIARDKTGKLVGVATAAKIIEFNTKQFLWTVRTFIDEQVREYDLASALVSRIIDMKRERFVAGYDPEVIGIVLQLQNPAFQLDHRPLCNVNSLTHGGMTRRLNKVGYDPEGGRNTVHYFEGAHIRFPDGEQAPFNRMGQSIDNDRMVYHHCFNQIDDGLAAHIIDFWMAEGAMPTREICAQRVKDVAMIAKQGEEICAVSSLFITPVPTLRTHLYGFRAFVGTKFRYGMAATNLAGNLWRELNTQFAAGELNPRLPGMVYLLQNKGMNRGLSFGISPRTGFFFAGFDSQGQQIRVKWFDKATLRDAREFEVL